MSLPASGTSSLLKAAMQEFPLTCAGACVGQGTPLRLEEHADASDGGAEGAAERERAYLGCKPLAPAEAARAAEAAEAGGAPRAGRIFYGNDTAYIFFRLHHLLYDRCVAAPACSDW